MLNYAAFKLKNQDTNKDMMVSMADIFQAGEGTLDEESDMA